MKIDKTIKLKCPNLTDYKDLDYDNSAFTIEFNMSHVVAVHDSNIDGLALIVFDYGGKVNVLKNEELGDFMRNHITKNPLFEKGYTRFGTFENETMGIPTPFSKGNRHVVFYLKDKYPMIEGFEDEGVKYKIWGNVMKLEA